MLKLVVQGEALAEEHLNELKTLSLAETVVQVAPTAWRFEQAHQDHLQRLNSYCEELQADFAFLPMEASLQDIGLVVMDMDSTLITIECIDEIADMLGLKEQVAAITELSMRGEIDFSDSLRRRVALLEGLEESALEKVYEERLRLTPGAEEMLQRFHEVGAKTLLVSGGFTFFTDRLKKRLGLSYVVANHLEVEFGCLTGRVVGAIVDAQTKADCLIKTQNSLHLNQNQVIAMGDGANDLKMLAVAGYGVAFHAKPIVRHQAAYSVNYGGLDVIANWFA